LEEGALADLLLVDSESIIGIELPENPAKSLFVIMKDRKIYQNSLTKL
jgi:hypothetical protein